MKHANDFFGLSKQPVNYHKDPAGSDILYSDGMIEMFSECKNQWFVIHIATQRLNRNDTSTFQTWWVGKLKGSNLAFISEDNTGVKPCKPVGNWFPYDMVNLWYCNGLLMFPSEYEFTD